MIPRKKSGRTEFGGCRSVSHECAIIAALATAGKMEEVPILNRIGISGGRAADFVKTAPLKVNFRREKNRPLTTECPVNRTRFRRYLQPDNGNDPC